MNSATPDFDAKQVFADSGTEVYRYTMEYFGELDMTDDHYDPDAWPHCGTLFRDHWVFFCDRTEAPHGPYFQRVIDADRTIIKETPQ